MKNRPLIALALSVLAVTLTTAAKPSLVSAIVSFVTLQPSTPGTAETGHLNISGTAKSGKVETGSFRLGTSAAAGKVLTADASGVGTWQTTTIPVPFVATSNVVSGTIVGTNTAATGTGVVGNATNTTGVNLGGSFGTSSSAGVGVKGHASATSGTATGGTFVTTSPTGYGAFVHNQATTGTPYSLYGFHNAPAGAAVLGLAFSSSGSAAGGNFRANGTTGAGVSANSTGPNGYGGYFFASGTSARGIYASATSATGVTTGGQFNNSSTSGYGVYSACTATTGPTRAGIFTAASNNARGLLALSTSTTGSTVGVDSQANSTDGIAVRGTAAATTGLATAGWFLTYSNGGAAIIGRNVNGNGNYGIVGGTSNPAGYGLYSESAFAAVGTKSFRIDHPFDPENTYLLHYCSEGPLPQNVYNGQVVTDAKGYAWVELPDYCEAITKDFLYQLTVLDDSDDFVQAKVTKPVAGNRFQIRTSKGGVRVCWEVKGTRNDAYMRKYGSVAVQEKPTDERGTYSDPSLYGKPKELGLSFRRSQGSATLDRP